MTSVHFSSKTEMWETPQDFFDRYNDVFGFDIDVCAIQENAKCAAFFSPETDGLNQDWKNHTCWMNPPYGREIKKWMRKAYESSLCGATVVCLVPARTDTFWWHEYAMKGEIKFIRGRLRFGGSKDNAPFPSAVVVFRPSGQMEGRRMSRTTCWYCGGELIWGGDIDLEEEDTYDIESNLTCSSCDAFVSYYIKVERKDDKLA